MVEDVSVTADALAQLHLISYINWQREHEEAFEIRRAQLLDLLAQLLHVMQEGDDSKRLQHFLLGGQTVLLEDIAAVQPGMVTRLAIYNAGGRLSVGPWYVQTDDMLVSGESLIRNLLHGRADMSRHNVSLTNVAYIPGTCQFTAQLPQILAGFNVDAVLLCPGQTMMPLPFVWEAPNGSYLLVMNYEGGDDIKKVFNRQRDARPDGPFLWMNDCDTNNTILPAINDDLPVPVRQSTLAEYVRFLRRSLPDMMRPVLKGEIKLQSDGDGRMAARLLLKQMNARLQARLSYSIEPLLALAYTDGTLHNSESKQSLLNHTWRLLMKNQAQRSLSGAISDDVMLSIRDRYRKVDDLAGHLEQDALNALPGKNSHQTTGEQSFLVVWNPHSRDVTQIVSTAIHCPDKRHPGTLYNPDNETVPYFWDDETDTLHFKAEAVAAGYTVYRMVFSLNDVPDSKKRRMITGTTTGISGGDSLSIENGGLTWKTGDLHLSNVQTFYDGGDAGDVYSYREPDEDFIVQATLMDATRVEVTPIYSRLHLHYRMRLAPSLDDNKRKRGLRVLDIHSIATLYAGIPGLYFKTTFENNAADHRLRVHLRTGLTGTTLLRDAAFALMSDAIDEHATGTQPIHSTAAILDNNQGMALYTRGLQSVEALRENAQSSFSLTLLRAIGRLYDDLTAPGAQHQETFTVEYMLQPLDADNRSSMLQTTQHYQHPVQVYQYDEAPPKSRQSYFTVDDNRALMTAFKTPQQGKGWILRFLNPTDEKIVTRLTAARKLQLVHLVNMAETPQAEYTITDNGINLQLDPQEIVTLHLQFE
ncbi:MAG: glycosyl hydrolase-related protein [Aggregatilineales bacterium]